MSIYFKSGSNNKTNLFIYPFFLVLQSFWLGFLYQDCKVETDLLWGVEEAAEEARVLDVALVVGLSALQQELNLLTVSIKVSSYFKKVNLNKKERIINEKKFHCIDISRLSITWNPAKCVQICNL